MRREIDEMNLTAYALGELEGAQLDAVEAQLAASPDDRRFVEESRSAARMITDALRSEPASGLDAIHYAAIEMRLREPQVTGRIDRKAVVRGRIGFALSLAASIAIVCGGIGAVLLTLSHHHDLATTNRATQPSEKPIFVPFDPANFARNDSGHGIARPGGGAEPFVSAADQPVSSFAFNADTTSYDELREALLGDRVPKPDSVRIEELVNAFSYDYPAPVGDAVFAGQVEVGQCPWQADHRLARIALKAKSGAGVVAEGVRTEITFDRTATKSWRLIGYDNATTSDAAGEGVAGGHAVTALYELVPTAPSVPAADLLSVRVRYRQPDATAEQAIEFAGAAASDKPVSTDFRFAAAVAEFGMLLRQSPQRGSANLDATIALAQAARGADPTGQRQQFIDLLRRAKPLLG